MGEICGVGRQKKKVQKRYQDIVNSGVFSSKDEENYSKRRLEFFKIYIFYCLCEYQCDLEIFRCFVFREVINRFLLQRSVVIGIYIDDVILLIKCRKYGLYFRKVFLGERRGDF